jgi:hypothetical protein
MYIIPSIKVQMLHNMVHILPFFVSLTNAIDVLLTNVMLDGPSTSFISVNGGARLAVCNTRNTQSGNINVTGMRLIVSGAMCLL